MVQSQLAALLGDPAVLDALVAAGGGEVVLSDAGVTLVCGEQEFGAEAEAETGSEEPAMAAAE
jgi:hypothetical protein